MKKLFLILTVLACFAFATSLEAQSRYAWKESNKDLPEQTVNNPRANSGIEIYTKPGVLIIRTPSTTNVKVLSILGQTISQAVIQPGTFELSLGTHGIFIVKADDYAIRVAL